MGNYTGQAIAIINGKQYDVTVNLQSDTTSAIQSWRGTLDANEGEAWEIYNADEGTLRLPGGREGRFLGTNYTVGMSSASSASSMTIVGNGEAPF